MDKKCSGCKKIKDSEKDFHKNKSQPDGLNHYCKPCNTVRVTQWQKNNKEKFYKYSKDRRYTRHNTTKMKIDKIIQYQNGLCPICNNKLEQDINIDHDHSCCPGSYSCGKCIRGVLCSGCNRGIGIFKDNIENLRRAIKYINAPLS